MERKFTANTSPARLKRNELYPVAQEYASVSAFRQNGRYFLVTPGAKIMAVWDGKPKRRPKKGEWYLSGALIAAYLAPSDLSSEAHIAELYEVTTRTELVLTSAQKIE